ncbi:MAG: carboxypeptidase regulatory-like domain-containing protein [Planctomycetota bacterium]
MTREVSRPAVWGWTLFIVLIVAAGAAWFLFSEDSGRAGDSKAVDPSTTRRTVSDPLESLGRSSEVLASELAEADSRGGQDTSSPAARTEARWISGRVVRAQDGSPVPHAEITLLRRPPALTLAELVSWERYRPGLDSFPGEATMRDEGGGLDRMSPPPPRDAPKVRANEDGLFRIDAGSFEEVYLAAEADGLYQSEFFGIDPDAAESQRIQLSLHTGTPLRGRVTDRSDRPVAGATVLAGDVFDPLSFATGAMGPMRSYETRTDRDGRFELLALPPAGQKYLKVLSKDFARYVETGIPCQPGVPIERDIVLSRGAIVRGNVRAGGEPVSGAEVEAHQKGISPLDVVGRMEGMRETKTGADGSFVLDRLSSGGWKVRVDARGWLPSKELTVTLEEEQVEKIDFELEPGEVIAGIVINEASQPVAGATITPERKRGMFELAGIERDIRLQSVGKAVTDAEGRFRCAGLVEGTYTLQVQAGGYSDAKRSEIETGTEGVVIRLPLPGAIEGAVISGDLFEPVADFTVEIPRKIDVPMASAMQVPGRVERYRDAGGLFRIDGVEPGAVELEIRAEGYVIAKVTDVVVVAGETTKGIRVVLQPGSRLAGRVVDPSGEPVSGARLTTKTGMERYMSAFDASGNASTDEQGRFEMAGLSPGTITVSVSHPDFAGASRRYTLETAQVIDDVEIVLSTGGTIEGRLIDASGKPASGQMVFATQPGRVDFKRATSDEDGYFLLTGLTAGTYQVTALLGLGGEAEDILAAIGSQLTQTVELPEDGHEFIEFRASDKEGGIRLTGRVTQAGAPLETGLLMVTPAGGSQQPAASGTIGENGRFEVKGLQPGDYQIVIQGGPGLGDFVPFELKVAEDAVEIERDFDLPGGEIEGVVVSAASGAPLSGVRVLARDGEGAGVAAPGMKQAITDAKGRFHFQSLKAGSYELVVGGSGFVGRADVGHEIVENVVVTGAKEDVGKIRLAGAGTLVGRVVAPNGDAPSGTLVGLEDDRGRSVILLGEAPLDDGGRFTIKGLSPGTYKVIVRTPGGEKLERSGIVVRLGEETPEVEVVVR